MHNVPEHSRQRYFTEANFHHTVNALAKLMLDKTFTPNDMTEALDVAKAKYYLDDEKQRMEDELNGPR